MFIAHMDEVQTKLKKLGMEKESVEGILKRYKEIGLPNWCVGFDMFVFTTGFFFSFLMATSIFLLRTKTITRFSGLFIPLRCFILTIWLKTLSR